MRIYMRLDFSTNDIPEFAEAVERFRRFLADSGHSYDVFWVFREDVWRLSLTDIRGRYPSPSENVALAKKVFSEDRDRGLVEITAVATAAGSVAATVWFPKYPEEVVQGWDRGMKIGISEPLPRARRVGRLRWMLLQCLPRFRQFQREAIFIGSNAWAAA
jgi:hypothetical protein